MRQEYCKFKTTLDYKQVQGQTGLYSKSLSQNNKKKPQTTEKKPKKQKTTNPKNKSN
jgi:hypothetical protein